MSDLALIRVRSCQIRLLVRYRQYPTLPDYGITGLRWQCT